MNSISQSDKTKQWYRSQWSIRVIRNAVNKKITVYKKNEVFTKTKVDYNPRGYHGFALVK